jgi:hypothetical protein
MALVDFHLTPALAAALERLGWTEQDALVRDTTPTAARGHNLVAVIPPAPAYAIPLLAGLLARPPGDEGPRTVLLLTPPELLGEWAAILAELLGGEGRSVLIATAPDPAARRLQDPPLPDLALLPPATALELRRRSLLGERIGAVLLAWPERWEDAEVLPALMQDVPREVQRALVTSAPDRSAAIVERHAWRALTIGSPVEQPAPRGPVRTVAVPWGRRLAVLPALVEQLNPETLAIWTADCSRHGEIRKILTGHGLPTEITHRHPRPASLVVAVDPPSPERLTELLEAGEVVLLVPPGAETWIARIAAPMRPLLLPEDRSAAGSSRRARIEQALRRGDLEPGLIALAPLFETHGAAAVASALYGLWSAADLAGIPAAAPPAATGSVSRIWVGVGRKDEAGPNDLVGLLANELRVARDRIGRIDVRETYSLVEVPAEDAEAIARAMTGRMVRRRKLVARVDRAQGKGELAKGRKGD